MTTSEAYATIGRIIGGLCAATAGIAIAINLVGGPLLLPALIVGAVGMLYAATLITRSHDV